MGSQEMYSGISGKLKSNADYHHVILFMPTHLIN